MGRSVAISGIDAGSARAVRAKFVVNGVISIAATGKMETTKGNITGVGSNNVYAGE